MDGGNLRTSAPAALFGESVTRFVESVESASRGEPTGQIPGDEESLRELIDSLPRLANAVALAFDNLAETVERLEPEEAANLISTFISRLDGDRLGKAVNSVSRAVIHLYESDPELFAESGAELTADVIEAIDFGKLRKQLTSRAKARADYRRRLIAMMGKEPVALINLVGLLPEYANNALALLHQLLDIITFPPEAVAFAMLQVVQEIHWEELSGALNSAFRLADSIQRGNLILGDGSSRIADVMEGVGEDIVRNLDFRGASRAVSAVCENLGPAAVSLATAAIQAEDGAPAVGGALLSLTNLLLNSASAVLDQVVALPPEVIARMSGGLREGLATRELGAAVNSALALFNRLAAEDPGLVGAILGGAFSKIDPAEAGAAGKALAAGIGGALRARDEGEGGLPEEMAAAANNALASFNRLSAEDRGLFARNLDRFLAGLDERQLEEAAMRASSQLAEAALRKPGVAAALARALLSAAFRFAKGYAKSLWTGRRKGVKR